MYQKEQLHDNTVSMMQSQHFSVSFIVQKNNISFLYTFYVMFIIILMDQNPFSILFAFNLQQMGRSAGFSLGGSYPSHRTQQQQQHAPSVSSNGVSFSSVNNQDLLHLHGTDIFPSSHSTYHSQVSKFYILKMRHVLLYGNALCISLYITCTETVKFCIPTKASSWQSYDFWFLV